MILHITTHEQWREAISLGIYRAASLEEEGFIHCSTQEQILRSADTYYRGQSGLQLLCISSSEVKASIVYEDSLKKGERFPHIYGPLNLDAVIQTFDFPPNADGSFSLPNNFQSQFQIPENGDFGVFANLDPEENHLG